MTLLRQAVFIIALGVLNPTNATTTYECTVEEYGPDMRQFCVFRNVQYFANTTNIIAFTAPTDKQPNVVFEDSELEHIPDQFLEKFGSNLKVLNASSCNLKSVVITSDLEELHANNNYISEVIVHQSAQSSPLKDIYLQSNRLTDISNITKNCKNARIVDLSRNVDLGGIGILDLTVFSGFDQLEYLMLADVGARYLDDARPVSMPALKMLDLSQNHLIASDLRIDYFQNFESLETLSLADNKMSRLDYVDLTKLKSLRVVHLEGNPFKCNYLKSMIEVLENSSIDVRVERSRCLADAVGCTLHKGKWVYVDELKNLTTPGL